MGRNEGFEVRRLGLYLDRFYPPYAAVISRLIGTCTAHGIEPQAASEASEHLAGFDVGESEHRPDAAMVLGGDGSILRGIDHYRGMDVPVLGVNTGHLGFLAGVEADDLERAIERLAAGEFDVEHLPVLKAEMPSGQVLTAVNDICVNRSLMGGILHLEMMVGGAEVARLAGDGLVISTPTGSTAYGLSCGGPILDPGLPAMLVVPICPHCLSLRPLVVPDDLTVTLRIGDLRGSGPVVSTDGRPAGTLREGESVTVGSDPAGSRRIVLPGGPGYYEHLGLKLGWGIRGR